MKKEIKIIILLLLMMPLFCACDTALENEDTTVQMKAQSMVEETEPDIASEPEWFSEDVIDEALSYLFVLEGEKDVGLAQELLLPLVEIGNAKAQYYWGYIYDHEIVDNNGEGEKESLYWYRLAAEQGYAKAYLAVALNEYVDPEEAGKRIEEAKEAGIFEMMPEELGADGSHFLAYYNYEEGNYDAALEWWQKAAEMGNTLSMVQIGLAYYLGEHIEENYEASLEWLQKAANLGDVYAMNYYGNILFLADYSEELVREKYDDAFELLYKAADAGCAIAMNNIGYYGYREGWIYADDDEEIKWYKKAAEAGYAVSMFNLGCLYKSGNATGRYEMAMEWFIKAYANGYDAAAEQIYEMLQNKQGVNAYFEHYGELIGAN